MSDSIRRIALAASDTLGLEGRLSPHFGRCHSWVLAEVIEGELREVRILANPFAGTHDCERLASLLDEIQVHEVVAGGLGARAERALRARGIRAATGFRGGIEESLTAYLQGVRPPARICEGHSHSH